MKEGMHCKKNILLYMLNSTIFPQKSRKSFLIPHTTPFPREKNDDDHIWHLPFAAAPRLFSLWTTKHRSPTHIREGPKKKKHMWFVISPRMRKCVFCFLCIFLFFFLIINLNFAHMLYFFVFFLIINLNFAHMLYFMCFSQKGRIIMLSLI